MKALQLISSSQSNLHSSTDVVSGNVQIRLSRSISHLCWSKKQSIGLSAATLGEKSSSKRNIFTPVRDSSRLSCISWGRPQFKLWGALKLILGKKYHWQLDRFSFLALPGYLNIKPLITPAVKDTLEKKWWWGNVFDLKEEPIYTFLTRLTPGGLMEWCAWFNWKAEQAPRPTNQPSRPHNLDPTFFTSEDTQWAGWLIKEKFCTVSVVKYVWLVYQYNL